MMTVFSDLHTPEAILENSIIGREKTQFWSVSGETRDHEFMWLNVDVISKTVF